MTYRCLLVILAMGMLGALNGCRRAATPQDSSKLPVFSVSVPVQREVTDYVEYTGRTGANEAEEIKARVTGFLVDTPFKEGAEIKKDDVLFKIDPRPYQAQYDQAAAQVGLYQSQLKLAKANYERDTDLFKRTKGAGVSKQAARCRCGPAGTSRCRCESRPGQSRSIQAEPRFLHRQVADRRPGWTLQPASRQPDHARFHAAYHRPVGRSHVRLFRHGYAQLPEVSGGHEQGAGRQDRGVDGAARRSGLSASGDSRFLQ